MRPPPQDVRGKFGDDWERIARMSIIEETPGGEKFVRMAFLACVASHTINGVAAIHSEIIKNTIFKDFYDLWPHKFQNKTNGVTQRRWLAFCNPRLRAIITERLGGESWITHLNELTALREIAGDTAFQEEWRSVKAANKERAARKVKRIHEYKRQLLNVLSIIQRYDAIKKASPEERKKHT
ncbi:starch phosphorylase [Monoraphidium neglectum]|uniref:Alpha-1,4 glucan phosphorylase n=1 Tax=Monoraphidium neglectum TaxID=145388 RepID=A0A0D2LL08_9CHLO|nr:starch phosphorylase [Monoraphidium neglectum]KIY92559.1 starch phosphorylase [Monoraphidium neglectum]|eukprot:XP_013891579.1 starch phosphorylase [Monoraphidium neglectum]